MDNHVSAIEIRKAARLAGFLFLLAMATGLFAEFYIHFPTALIINNDTAKTTTNISSHERLYRIGIANNLLTFAIDVVLIWALYIVLKPINRNLALLAVFFRLVETTLISSFFSSCRNHPGLLCCDTILHCNSAIIRSGICRKF